MKGIVFCHGWGMAPWYFNNLKSFLKDYKWIDWNLGYSGIKSCPIPEHPEEYIAIGHSLGYFKLLESQIPFKEIIGLQGFTSFLGYRKSVRQLRLNQLQELILQFEKKPEQTLHTFLKTCGLQEQEQELLQYDFLANDLLSLKNEIEIKRPITILSCQTDLVVTERLLQDHKNYLGSSLSLFQHDTGDHLLGYKEAPWCYKILQTIIPNLKKF